MSFLNHPLPDWSCYIRNEFLFNGKQGHGEVSKCDVHSVENNRTWETSKDYFYEVIKNETV